MKNLKSIFLLAIMLIACQAMFAQTDKGIEYYNNKDYANAVRWTSEQGILGKAPSFRIKMAGLQLNINSGTRKNSDNGFRIPNRKGQ